MWAYSLMVFICFKTNTKTKATIYAVLELPGVEGFNPSVLTATPQLVMVTVSISYFYRPKFVILI